MIKKTTEPEISSSRDLIVIGVALAIAGGGFGAFALTGHGLELAIVALLEALKAYRQ